MTSLPKTIASILEVPPPARALYDYAGDYYALTPGGQHLRVVREITMAEKEEFGASYGPAPSVFEAKIAKQKLPEISLRDWTSTISAAITSERATLMRLLSAGKIKIHR